MASQSLDRGRSAFTPDEGPAFLRNARGEVCIAFDDPAYVQMDAVLFDPSHRAIHAILHQDVHFLGEVSPDMAEAIGASTYVLLTARRADGGIFDLPAPVITKRHESKRTRL